MLTSFIDIFAAGYACVDYKVVVLAGVLRMVVGGSAMLFGCVYVKSDLQSVNE